MRLGLMMLLIGTCGCPGRISNPSIFSDAAAAFHCPAGYDAQKEVLQAKCATAGCHTTSSPVANLDLQSDGVASRLYGVAAAQCKGQVLLDETIPFAGYLFDKVEFDTQACGSRMPYGGAKLSQQEVDCLHLWLAQQKPDASSGGSSGGSTP